MKSFSTLRSESTLNFNAHHFWIKEMCMVKYACVWKGIKGPTLVLLHDKLAERLVNLSHIQNQKYSPIIYKYELNVKYTK